MDKPPVEKQVHNVFELLMYYDTYFFLPIIPSPILD